MKKLSLACVALCIGLSGAAWARAETTSHFSSSRPITGVGSHSSSRPVTGGAFGTSPAAPGTNSLGTALPSSGLGNGPQKGPLLGTNPAIDREDAKVEKMIGSICRGC